MIAVVQRVTHSQVSVDDEKIGKIEKGLTVFLGVTQNDTESDAIYLAEKIANLRIFEDDAGKMNLSLLEVGASMLVAPQFTLLGDCRKGRRPSFAQAAKPEKAESLYLFFTEHVRELGIKTATGRFRAHMQVELTNDGPVTLIVESAGNQN
ncbi:MAG: D-tyrosyl-tRNA(Tyr) deacylase [Desulfobacteraceae bacterium]|nr:D-tyrosyl-tRNA(Tyr) deacylase [Desulfobacteraceae bacterium]